MQAVDGRTITEWLADDGGTTRSVGEVVRYEVRRSAAELPLVLQLDVRLTRYPLAAALSDNLPTVAFTVLLLAAGALTFWRRPESPSARAFLATTALVPMAITAAPCGLGAIDLAGGRGIWPHAGGELWCALGHGHRAGHRGHPDRDPRPGAPASVAARRRPTSSPWPATASGWPRWPAATSRTPPGSRCS